MSTQQPEAREFTMSQYASKDCMIGAMRERIAELESQLESSGFTAADMATAEARGFRDGVASVAASAGEPVAHLWQHCETGRTRIVMPDMIVDADASWQVVGPLYLGAAQPTAQAEGWMPIETAPKDGTLIVLGARNGVWLGKYVPVYQSGYRPENPWSSMLLNHDHMAERYTRPTHWMPLPPSPTTFAGSGKWE